MWWLTWVPMKGWSSWYWWKSGSRRSDNIGGETVGTDTAGDAVGETVRPAVVCGTVGEAVGTAELGRKVGEPVGMAVVAGRVEMAVGPGLDGPMLCTLSGWWWGPISGASVVADVHRDIVGEAVGTNAAGNAFGEAVWLTVASGADVGVAEVGLDAGEPDGVVVVGDHVGMAGLRLDGAEAGPVVVVAVADDSG